MQSKVAEFGWAEVELQPWRSRTTPAAHPRSVSETEHSTPVSGPGHTGNRSAPVVPLFTAQLAELPNTSTSPAQVLVVLSLQVKNRVDTRSTGLPPREKHKPLFTFPSWSVSTSQQPSSVFAPETVVSSKSKRRYIVVAGPGLTQLLAMPTPVTSCWLGKSSHKSSGKRVSSCQSERVAVGEPPVSIVTVFCPSSDSVDMNKGNKSNFGRIRLDIDSSTACLALLFKKTNPTSLEWTSDRRVADLPVSAC